MGRAYVFLILYPSHSAQYLAMSNGNGLAVLAVFKHILKILIESQELVIFFGGEGTISLGFWKVDAKLELKVQGLS